MLVMTLVLGGAGTARAQLRLDPGPVIEAGYAWAGVAKGPALGLGFGFTAPLGTAVGLRVEPLLRVRSLSFATGGCGFAGCLPEEALPIGEATDRVSHLEVPVRIQWAVSTGGSLRPVLEAGPSAEFRAGCSELHREEQLSQAVPCREDVRSAAVALVVGAGVRARRLAAGIRAGFGLTSFAREPRQDAAAPFLGKERRVSAYVTFRL